MKSYGKAKRSIILFGLLTLFILVGSNIENKLNYDVIKDDNDSNRKNLEL